MTAIDTAISPLSESDHNSQLRRAVIASTVGTAIEWYDFLLYSAVTGLVFAQVLSNAEAESSIEVDLVEPATPRSLSLLPPRSASA